MERCRGFGQYGTSCVTGHSRERLSVNSFLDKPIGPLTTLNLRFIIASLLTPDGNSGSHIGRGFDEHPTIDGVINPANGGAAKQRESARMLNDEGGPRDVLAALRRKKQFETDRSAMGRFSAAHRPRLTH